MVNDADRPMLCMMKDEDDRTNQDSMQRCCVSQQAINVHTGRQKEDASNGMHHSTGWQPHFVVHPTTLERTFCNMCNKTFVICH